MASLRSCDLTETRQPSPRWIRLWKPGPLRSTRGIGTGLLVPLVPLVMGVGLLKPSWQDFACFPRYGPAPGRKRHSGGAQWPDHDTYP